MKDLVSLRPSRTSPLPGPPQPRVRPRSLWFDRRRLQASSLMPNFQRRKSPGLPGEQRLRRSRCGQGCGRASSGRRHRRDRARKGRKVCDIRLFGVGANCRGSHTHSFGRVGGSTRHPAFALEAQGSTRSFTHWLGLGTSHLAGRIRKGPAGILGDARRPRLPR